MNLDMDISLTKDGMITITIRPNEELWQAIRNKEFVVDDVMGMAPDLNTYTDEERVGYFIQGCIEHIAEMYDLQNPSVWIESTLECLEEYKEYLKDLNEYNNAYTEERYQYLKNDFERIIRLLQDDVNCFCV